MRRRLWSLVAFTTFLFCLVPSAAQAADEVGLSWDGSTWSEQLSEPMFDPAARWVPGDVGTKVFHVRNQAESGAILTIAVATRDDDGLLRYEDIRLSARVGTEDWMDLESTEQNFRLSNDALPAGESRKVEVRAHFDFASPNRSQNKQLALKFIVTLTDAQASPGGPGDPGEVEPTAPETPGQGEPTDPGTPGEGEPTDPGRPGDVDDGSKEPLPNAGAPAVGWVIVAAGVAIGSGLTLITRRKREETEHDTSH